MTPAEQYTAHIRRYFQEIVGKGNLEAINVLPDHPRYTCASWSELTDEEFVASPPPTLPTIP